MIIKLSYLLKISFLMGFFAGIPIFLLSAFQVYPEHGFKGLVIVAIVTPPACGFAAFFYVLFGYPAYEFFSKKRLLGIRLDKDSIR
jgi:hypothetical protein